MSKWKVVLYNQETYEIENDCVDDEIFKTEEDAQAFIDAIYEHFPEGREVLSQCGRHESGSEYGFGNNDLVLQVDEAD